MITKNVNSNPIELLIEAQNPNNPDWTCVVSSSGRDYWYMYTGGDDGQGGVNVSVSTNEGPCLARVRLRHQSSRYRIVACDFKDDDNDQLTWVQLCDHLGVIVNQNVIRQTAYYGIVVKDHNATTTGMFVCDPGIKNKPLVVNLS